MAWTTFATLTSSPTLPELDANFSALSYLINISCNVVGTNSIVLTSTAGATTYTQYQQGMILRGVATNTNSGAMTAALGALPALPVYKDTSSGPIILAGGEIIQLTAFSLMYDMTLNSGGGGWHLQDSDASLTGSTLASLSVTKLGATSLNVSNLNVGTQSFGTVVATLGTINALLVGIGSLGTLQIGTGAVLSRLNSTLASAVFTAILPAVSQDQTIAFTGVQPFDNIMVGWSLAPTASLVFSQWSPAAGSVVLRAFNPLPAVTVTPGTLTFRLTNVGWT